MSKNHLHLLLFQLLIFLLVPSLISAQPWVKNLPQDKLKNNELTLIDFRKAFDEYWEPFDVKNGYYFENGEKKKAYGWKQFKRWEYYWEPRVDPKTGEFPKVRASDVRRKLRMTGNTRTSSGTWTGLGPSSSGGGYAGIGRLNCIAFSNDNDRFYVGSPSGGLWKTTDGGASWTPLTDQNDVLGISDAVVISTSGDDIIYIATGDRDGGSMWSLGGGQYNDNNSIGVLKSTDGGSTWSTTGLSFSASDKKVINRLLVDPNDNNTLIAATSSGVYKTTDAGSSWTKVYSTVFIDMEYKPGSSTTIYGSTKAGKIYRSTNGGSSWTLEKTVSGGYRVALAVSADEPTWVYAVVVDGSGGLLSVQKSTDSGDSFSQIFNSTNLLCYQCDGSGTGGQGSYDLALAADPTDANVIFVGGINTWKSTDGGSTWSIKNHWSGGGCTNIPVVHADKHYMAFRNGTSTLFECNDGGVYKTTDGGASWVHLTNTMAISQIYRMGVSQATTDDIIIGLQDNGTKSMESGVWTDVIGGDGFDCAIDPITEQTQYGSLYYGRIRRTTNKWGSNVDITNNGSSPINGITETGYWCTPFQIDPQNHTTIYVGMKNVWKSTNQGTNWSKISNFTGSTTLKHLAVAPSGSNTIYIGTFDQILVTTDGGSSWSDITSGLPVGSSNITSIAVKNDDPNTVWVSMGNYNSNCVFESTDGGATWTDISAGLPSIPVMCVIQNKQNTNDVELYAGTDVGVYVKVGSANWVTFSSDLPNVVVNDLEIYYDAIPAFSKIRAATSGRGVWESNLYSDPNSPPEAYFSADKTNPVVNETVHFTDYSVHDPTNWHWTFDPATVEFLEGTSATSQNPVVRFTATGSYDVTLYVENANGNDTKVESGYITVSTGSPTYCTASGGGDEYISGVQIGDINNTGTGSDGYYDYTSFSTDVNILSANNITITNGHIYQNDDLGIWIDWNQDGDFDDSDENVICTGDDSANGTYSFSVPASAKLGSTRMRIRIKWSGTDCGSPCGNTTYGEVEDYTLNIIAGNVTWEGTASTDWDDPTNWSNGEVPTSSFSVTIPSNPTGSVFPVISSSSTEAECQDLTIQTGASLTINGFLTVDGTLTNNAGTSGLVIGSSSSGTGSLITDTDNVDGTVERYLEGGVWHLIGASADNQTISALYFNHNPDVWLKEYVENEGTSGGWDFVWQLTTPMPPGKGFAVWVKNGYNVKPSFEGPLKSSDLTVSSLDYTDASHGYNLLSNPFPSALDWDQGGWGKTNLDGSVWVYDHSISNYRSRNSHGIGSLTDGIIPVSSGFFVRAVSSGASLTIPALAKVHHAQNFYKNASQNRESGTVPYLVLQVSDGNDNRDEVWLAFSDECTEQFDLGWDVKKIKNLENAPALYFVQDDEQLSIDALPLPDGEDRTVNLDFEAGNPGQHSLMLTDFSQLDETDIYLEDRITGDLQDMKEQNEYSFEASTNDPSGRFLIHISPVVTKVKDPENPEYLIYAWDKNIYIRTNMPAKNRTVQIIDLYGRVLVEKTLSNASLNVIPVQLSNAALMVRIIDLRKIETKKVFIR